MKNRVLILGSTGMLGNAVLTEFKKNDEIELTFTSRDKSLGENFSVEQGNLKDIVDKCRPNWIINCIGLINSYIHENDKKSIELARVVNEKFPQQILDATEKHDSRIIQIATDCVYSGIKGEYSETDLKDPVDAYGLSKSRGEVLDDRFMHLRCSIIGRDARSSRSLLEWFLSNEAGARVSGYVDHFWNGITTDAFARICMGIIRDDLFKSGVSHQVPENSVNKYQLLQLFQERFNRNDLEIVPVNTNQGINRTISTIFEYENEQRWKSAGYERIPSIGALVENL
jgi:dTDP-4-dehydrorhamnose reductase